MADVSPVPFIIVVWTLQLLLWLFHLPQTLLLLLLVQTQQGCQSDLISTTLQTARAGQAWRVKTRGV